MAGEGGSGGVAPPGDRDWLQLSSFDAASFFAQQQQQQQDQRAAQGQALRAAADLLLPSSSDDDSSSGESGGEEGGVAGGRRRRRTASPGSGRDGKRGREVGRPRDGRDAKRRRRAKDGKERRRRHESEQEQQVRLERQKGAAQRAPQVKAWASSDAPAGKDAYYFDTRGDPANLAFGGLYRMDQALYRRFDPAAFAAALGARRGPSYGVRRLATEGDGHAQRERAARYFGPASQRAERSARLKRWRPQREAEAGRRGRGEAAAGSPSPQRPRLDLPSPGFLPLRADDGDRQQQQQRAQPGAAVPSAAEELAAEAAERVRREGETWEEALLRRTREYNVATRQRPHDVPLWLEFARFQDEALRLGGARRGGERAAAEKKVAILERALSLHPGSDDLLLALLQAAEAVCDEAELGRRWRGVLARHSGSPRLWRAFLHHRRTRFAGFSAVEVAAAYDQAFDALRREHARRADQGAPADVLEPLEAEAAGLAVEGAQLRLAAGATERGVAALQVLLEYNFLGPEGWPVDALEAMFREYWASGAPLAGQAGSSGWAAWMAGEPDGDGAREARQREAQQRQEERQQRQQQQQEEQGQEQQSGWEELAPAIRARFGHALRVEAAGGEGAADAQADEEAEEVEAEEAEEAEPQQEEETDEQLMERLGMSLEAALEEAGTTLTPPLLQAWLAVERRRQAAQWQPRRAEAAAREGSGSEEEEEGADRSVGWDEVRRLLWRFESPAARQQLLAGCLRLLGAPLPGVLPSNSPAAAGAGQGADELWQAAAATGCHPPAHAAGWAAQQLAQGDWAWLLEGPEEPLALRQQPWYRADEGRRAWLQQLLALLVGVPSCGDAAAAEALLAVASAAAPAPDWGRARDLARHLLAGQRANLALWQAYAQLELAAGSAKAARKVYQTCFATVGAPASLAAATAAAPLVVGAAQLELGAPPLPLPAAEDAAPGGGLLPSLLGAAPDAAVAAAARQLAWLGSGGAAALPARKGGAAAAAPPSQQEVVSAKRGFQDHLLALMQQHHQRQQAGGAHPGLAAGSRMLVVAAAAFEQLVGRLRGDAAAGVRAALAIHDQVLAALLPPPPAPAPADAQLELLGWQRCQLAADAARLALPCAPPAAVRGSLLAALRRYPASPALLQLLLAHEAASHTFAQLRRELGALLQLDPSPQLWLAMVAVEVVTRSPVAVLRATLERAVGSDAGRPCPLLWRCYLRFEARRGRPEAVRRVFLRAINSCPWSKAVWCDGLALLNGHVPPKELSGYVEMMRDRAELVLRTDVFEVVLAQLEGGDAAGGGAPGGAQTAAGGGA